MISEKKFGLSIYCGESSPFQLIRTTQQDYDQLVSEVTDCMTKGSVITVNTGHDTFPQAIVLNGTKISAIAIGTKLVPKDKTKEIPV